MHPAVVDILQYVVVLALVFVVSLMASVLAIVYSAWVRHFSSSWMLMVSAMRSTAAVVWM